MCTACRAKVSACIAFVDVLAHQIHTKFTKCTTERAQSNMVVPQTLVERRELSRATLHPEIYVDGTAVVEISIHLHRECYIALCWTQSATRGT